MTALRITGDFGRLASLKALLRSTPRLTDQIVAEQGLAAMGLYQDGFAAKRDPYGKGWAPGVDLVQTGELANPALAMFPAGFRIRVAKHGYYHQFGWIPGRGRKALAKEVGPIFVARGRALRRERASRISTLRSRLISDGASHVPARKVIPTPGAPGTWLVPLKAVASKRFRAHFGGR
jgi:hypothetical protein